MYSSSRVGFRTVPPAGIVTSDHASSFFQHVVANDGDFLAGLFNEEGLPDLFQGEGPSDLFQMDFPEYAEDQSLLISNPQSAKGRELGALPHDWLRGDDYKEINEFTNLRNSPNSFLSAEEFQAPVIPKKRTGALAPVDRHELNGRDVAPLFAPYGQYNLSDHNPSDGFDSYGENGSINVNQNNGFASYRSPMDDFDIYGQLGLMDDYSSNGLDAHNTQMTASPASQNQFVPLYQDETAFRNRKALRTAGRVISDYPANDLRAQHEIIARIYSAIRNTEDVQDSDKTAMKFSDDSIPDEAIHEVCWEIMLKCRDSQEMGILVAKYHGTKHTQQNSFMERIDSIVETLTKSKAACRQALAPSFIDRLVDQPNEELKRKSCNQKLNSKKTGQNKAGQQAIAKSMADAAGKWIDVHRLEYEDDPQTLVPQPTGPEFGAKTETLAQQATGPARKRARKN